jgi:hypothetical protein
VVGTSRGAEAALLIGATYPELVRGVAACAPSSVVNLSPNRVDAAWTLSGSPLPSVPLSEIGTWTPTNPEAIIKVERIEVRSFWSLAPRIPSGRRMRTAVRSWKGERGGLRRLSAVTPQDTQLEP